MPSGDYFLLFDIKFKTLVIFSVHSSALLTFPVLEMVANCSVQIIGFG